MPNVFSFVYLQFNDFGGKTTVRFSEYFNIVNILNNTKQRCSPILHNMPIVIDNT